jgi:integrase
MARQPEKPWYWTARDWWVVQWGGKRIRLSKGKKNKREAFDRFNQMVAETGKPSDAAPVPTVGELTVLYLRDLRHRRDRGDIERQTKPDAERRMAGFAEMHGDLPADRVRLLHVDEWLATKAGWNATSRHDGVGAVKTLFRWARRKGHIEVNPLADADKPSRVKRREMIPTPEQAERAIAAVVTPELLDLLVFIAETGAGPRRPGRWRPGTWTPRVASRRWTSTRPRRRPASRGGSS